MLQNIPYGRRRNVRKLLSSRDYDGLDIWCELAVCVRDGALRFEIDHVSHASDHVVDAVLVAGVDGQIVILYDADAVQALNCLTYNVYALIHVEESALVLIYAYGHDYFIEHGQCSFENVQMACRKRVERPWEQCFCVHNCQSIGVLPSDFRISFV